MINVDEMLKSGKKDELLKAIADRELEIKAEEKKKAEAAKKAKQMEKTANDLREKAAAALKAYIDFTLDTSISDTRAKNYVIECKELESLRNFRSTSSFFTFI